MAYGLSALKMGTFFRRKEDNEASALTDAIPRDDRSNGESFFK